MQTETQQSHTQASSEASPVSAAEVPSPDTDSLDQQEYLEELSMARGGERFKARVLRAQQAGQASSEGGAVKLLTHALLPTEKAIEEALETYEGPGRKPIALKWVRQVGVETAAYLAVKTILDGVAHRIPTSRAAQKVAEYVLDELRFRRLKEEAPALFEFATGRFTTSHYGHRKRSLGATLAYADVDVSDLNPSPTIRLHIGMWLISRVIESTGLVSMESRKVAKGGKRKQIRTESYLVAEPETLQWLADRDELLASWAAEPMPMVVQPLPWGPDGERGGYAFGMTGKYPLVRGVSKEHRQMVEESSIPTVLRAVNAIQSTAWAVNRRVLWAVREIEQGGGGVAGVPSMEPLGMPVKPSDIDENEVARREWRRRAAKVKNAEVARVSSAVAYQRTLRVAEEMETERAIYFPHTLDFRGRVYPVSSHLSPQGDDLCRGLLRFSAAEPLGAHGARWLAIHGANCLGEFGDLKVSKLSLDERVRWIEDHTDMIRGAAQDPAGDRWWTGADEPLQFLAFAFEWDDLRTWVEAGHPKGEFRSPLPVAVDGTANGLQHLSAMLRDPVGAKAVNVSPTERPEDLYQRVADKALDLLETRAGSQEEDANLAALWLTSGLVDRGLAKRPCMTAPYGSKKFGFRSQVIEHLKKQENWGEIRDHFSVEAIDEETGEIQTREAWKPAASLMARILWEALEGVVVKSMEALEWLQQGARVAAKAGERVEWTVPITGFPVRQPYMVQKDRKVETILAGSVFRPNLKEDTDEVEAYRQANAMSPNFVHSLDAAALMLTALELDAEGVHSHGWVHDSYAVHAGFAPALNSALRRAFVYLYDRSDPVAMIDETFRALAGADLADEILEAPKQGGLDLGLIHGAEYFFS